METPKTLTFIAERLKGGAYAVLADIALHQTVEPLEPVTAAIYYFPDRTEPGDEAA